VFSDFDFVLSLNLVQTVPNNSVAIAHYHILSYIEQSSIFEPPCTAAPAKSNASMKLIPLVTISHQNIYIECTKKERKHYVCLSLTRLKPIHRASVDLWLL
jgi:hypothetical protein